MAYNTYNRTKIKYNLVNYCPGKQTHMKLNEFVNEITEQTQSLEIFLTRINFFQVRQITNIRKVRILRKIWNCVRTNSTSVAPTRNENISQTNSSESIFDLSRKEGSI